MSIAERCRQVAVEAREKSDENRRLIPYAADTAHYTRLTAEFYDLAVKIENIAALIEIQQEALRREVTV